VVIVAERRDSDHRSGARLPVAKQTGPSYQRALEIMAKREAVHCGGCGSVAGVIELVGVRGGLGGRFPVCESCFRHFNPVDPLEMSA
jgi:hypothetical protein